MRLVSRPKATNNHPDKHPAITRLFIMNLLSVDLGKLPPVLYQTFLCHSAIIKMSTRMMEDPGGVVVSIMDQQSRD